MGLHPPLPGGTWSRTVPQAPPSGSWMELDKAYTPLFASSRASCCVRPPKTCSPQEQRTPEFRGSTGSLLSLKCLQDGDLARSRRAQPARALLPGSEGKERPRRLPWALREATGAWLLRGVGQGGQAMPSDHPSPWAGPGQTAVPTSQSWPKTSELGGVSCPARVTEASSISRTIQGVMSRQRHVWEALAPCLEHHRHPQMFFPFPVFKSRPGLAQLTCHEP